MYNDVAVSNPACDMEAVFVEPFVIVTAFDVSEGHVIFPVCVIDAVWVAPLYTDIPLAPFAVIEAPIIFPELSIVDLALATERDAAVTPKRAANTLTT